MDKIIEFVTDVPQLIGFAAAIFSIFAFQYKKRGGILIMQATNCLLWAVHFFMLKQYAGAAINLVGLFRNAVFYFKDKKWAQSRWWLYFFIGMVVVSGITTYQSYVDILPIIGSTLSTIALYETEERKIRLLSLANCPFWLAYDVLTKSVGGVITQIFIIVSISVAMLRFKEKKADKKEKEDNAR